MTHTAVPLFDLGLPPIDAEDERTYVMAATAWSSNAELVLDAARLGYLDADRWCLDATFGEGIWWGLWRPDVLVTNDLDPTRGVDLVADFGHLPFADQTFDDAVFDPPYIAPGGRDSSTVPRFNRRYGIGTTPRSPAGLQSLINAGLAEVARVVRPGGYILVKVKNYVYGGRLWGGAFRTWAMAERLGLELVDCLQHLAGTGPQSQTTQEHARENYSTLLIVRKRKLQARNPGHTVSGAGLSPRPLQTVPTVPTEGAERMSGDD